MPAFASAGDAFNQPMGSSMVLGSAGVSSDGCGNTAWLASVPLLGDADAATSTARPAVGNDAAAEGGVCTGCRTAGVVCSAPVGACNAGNSVCPPLRLRHRTAVANASAATKPAPRHAATRREAAMRLCGATDGFSHVVSGLSATSAFARTQSPIGVGVASRCAALCGAL